jgi:hypothetical protein
MTSLLGQCELALILSPTPHISIRRENVNIMPAKKAHHMSNPQTAIAKVVTAADTKAFVALPYRLYANNPNWVPPLKSEVHALLSAKKNPWFDHGKAQLFLARRDDRVTGRISAHIDDLALTQPAEQGMGPGTGFWGFLEAEDKDTAVQLLKTAEDWLRANGMDRSMGPLSFSYWDEIGLLVDGFATPPTVMMPYNSAEYQAWVEKSGYAGVEDLFTYRAEVRNGFPDLVNRVVALGEKNDRIRIRKVNKSRFDEEAALIIGILNDAWSDNWGFVPFTDREIAYAGKKLKPLIFEELVRVAELDGEPVAFMMAIPDLNERLADFGGNLLPFNWAKLLWWLRKPKAKKIRVALMGVAKSLQATRTASQLAMMLIEHTRRDAAVPFGTEAGDFGWVLASNESMRSIGEAVGGVVDKTYRIYVKAL